MISIALPFDKHRRAISFTHPHLPRRLRFMTFIMIQSCMQSTHVSGFMLEHSPLDNQHQKMYKRTSFRTPFQSPIRTTKTSFLRTSATTPPKQPSTSSMLSHNRDLQHILDVAKEAALQAGEIMKTTSGKIATKSKANAADLVTASDVECQATIQNVIMEHFPQDFFLGEEDVDAGSVASVHALESMLSRSLSQNNDNEESEESTGERFVWIVDPIGE